MLALGELQIYKYWNSSNSCKQKKKLQHRTWNCSIINAQSESKDFYCIQVSLFHWIIVCPKLNSYQDLRAR